MLRFLFVLMNEYRVWGIAKAAETLAETYPEEFFIRIYSVQQVNHNSSMEQSLLLDSDSADMIFIASHGSIQNLFCFTKLWELAAG